LMAVSLCTMIGSALGVLYLILFAWSDIISLGEDGLALILLLALLIIGLFGFAFAYLDSKSKRSRKEWKAMTVIFPRVGVLHNQHLVEQLREEEDQRYHDDLRQDELAKMKKD
jgi:hypothetical protein